MCLFLMLTVIRITIFLKNTNTLGLFFFEEFSKIINIQNLNNIIIERIMSQGKNVQLKSSHLKNYYYKTWNISISVLYISTSLLSNICVRCSHNYFSEKIPMNTISDMILNYVCTSSHMIILLLLLTSRKLFVFSEEYIFFNQIMKSIWSHPLPLFCFNY